MSPSITHDTPIGPLALSASEDGLTRVASRRVSTDDVEGLSAHAAELIARARHELDDYFAGRLRRFEVPIDLSRVTGEQRQILDYLAEHVGYGETVTYGDISTALKLADDGARRVGIAMARNPLMIIVPCHRVLGAGGKMTGYSGGGVGVKRRLLDLEGWDRSPGSQLELGLG
jgi:methylated-DNA-[protein]-cysteine S-methyltransferase